MRHSKSSAFHEYKSDLNDLIIAYKAIDLSDAFVNIVNRKVDKTVLENYNLNDLLSKVIKVYPTKYIHDLFFIRLVTLLEEYLKNRLIEEFNENENSVNNFLLNYITDRKLTPLDVIHGPQKLSRLD